MIKKLITIAVSLTAIMLMSGCAGSSNTSLQVPLKHLTQDKNKAYVVFMRKDTFAGSAHYPRIVEYLPKENDIKFVGELSIGEKIVYPITEGKHYFFTNYFTTNMNKIDAKAGQIYYVNVNRLGLVPNLDNAYNKKTIKRLLHNKCDKYTLNQYLFEDNTPMEEESDSILPSKNSQNTLYKSPSLVKIECNNNEIVAVDDFTEFNSMDELKEDTEFVQPSESALRKFNNHKSSYLNEAKAYYPLWKLKLEDLPFTDFYTFLKVNKEIGLPYYQQYKDIKIIAGNHLVNNENVKLFDERIRTEFHSLLNNNSNLTMKYTVIKEDNGSQVGRYTMLSLDSIVNNMASIQVRFEFYSNNKLIGSVEVSDLLTGGIFGGFNSLDKNVINLAKKYVVNNLLINKK